MEPQKVNSLKVLFALLVLIASAYVSFDLNIAETKMPFTAQSLVVFVVAALLKPKTFFIVIISYLTLGVVGLPVFADGSSGWSKIIGGSGGFLYGFVFSGLFISFCFLKISCHWSNSLLVMLLGTVMLFVFGLGQLIFLFGIEKALEYGLYPFWKMAIIKAIVATILVNISQLIALKCNK